jgi:hypothetical protein
LQCNWKHSRKVSCVVSPNFIQATIAAIMKLIILWWASVINLIIYYYWNFFLPFSHHDVLSKKLLDTFSCSLQLISHFKWKTLTWVRNAQSWSQKWVLWRTCRFPIGLREHWEVEGQWRGRWSPSRGTGSCSST